MLHDNVHPGLKEPVAPAAALLCTVEREIGISHDIRRIISVLWNSNNADAGPGGDFTAV
jgi:hypothetical protein